tara:strand:+ start:3576 stop:3746 length:171 start_codon:yes stop_codon:yes gene_type:complete
MGQQLIRKKSFLSFPLDISPAFAIIGGTEEEQTAPQLKNLLRNPLTYEVMQNVSYA